MFSVVDRADLVAHDLYRVAREPILRSVIRLPIQIWARTFSLSVASAFCARQSDRQSKFEFTSEKNITSEDPG